MRDDDHVVRYSNHDPDVLPTGCIALYFVTACQTGQFDQLWQQYRKAQLCTCPNLLLLLLEASLDHYAVWQSLQRSSMLQDCIVQQEWKRRQARFASGRGMSG